MILNADSPAGNTSDGISSTPHDPPERINKPTPSRKQWWYNHLMAKATSLLICVFLPLALLLPTAVAHAAPESDDQEFAQDLNEEGMLFNFNLQRRIAQDYCSSVIFAYNSGRGYPDLSYKSRQVQEEYGLPRAYAFETLLKADVYCTCTDSYLWDTKMFNQGERSAPPTFMPIFSCSAYEIQYANRFGYQLPVAR